MCMNTMVNLPGISLIQLKFYTTSINRSRFIGGLLVQSYGLEMYKLLFFVIFLVGKCLGDGELITLNLAYNSDNPRFMRLYHYFRGIQYITLTPMIGYRVGKVLYGDVPVYIKVDGDDDLETVYIYHNEEQNNAPIFILKSANLGNKYFPLAERSPHDEQNYICAITLMKYVKLFSNNHKVQQMLADIENEDPPEMTLNTMIYRVFHGAQYLGGNDKIHYGRILSDEELRSRNERPNLRKRQRTYEYDDYENPKSKKSN